MFSRYAMMVARKNINKHLVDTAMIERYEDVPGEYGELVRTLVSSTEVGCYLVRRNQGADEMLAGADQSRVFYEIQLPYDADIRDGDEVVVNGNRYGTVQVYRAQSVDVMRQALLVKAGS